MSVSRSVQLLETELSLWLVLDYGTVCHYAPGPSTSGNWRVFQFNVKSFQTDNYFYNIAYLLECRKRMLSTVSKERAVRRSECIQLH